MTTAQHPFYPRTLNLPAYRAHAWSVPGILVPFFLAVGAVCALTLWLCRRQKNTKLSTSDRVYCCWFAVCACIHTFFEGYFVLNNRRMQADVSWFGAAWKV